MGLGSKHEGFSVVLTLERILQFPVFARNNTYVLNVNRVLYGSTENWNDEYAHRYQMSIIFIT